MASSSQKGAAALAATVSAAARGGTGPACTETIATLQQIAGVSGVISRSGTNVICITNQPELGLSQTFGEVGVTTIDGGDQGSVAKLGFNAPLGAKAAFRVVGYSTRTGGWIDAVRPDLTVSPNINGSVRAGLRAALRLAPSSRFRITPRLVYQDMKADGWNRQDAGPPLCEYSTRIRL